MDLKRIIIYAIVICSVVGIFIAVSLPRPKLSLYDKIELSKIIANCNEDLPYEIGTIGTLDSIYLSETTIVYSLTVNGDENIMNVYAENYEEFKDMLKYSLIEINGQRNMGNVLTKALDYKGLNIGYKVYTKTGKNESWTFTGEDLLNFVDSCRLSPTNAMHNVIDMQIKLANLQLPLDMNSKKDVSTVALNSVIGEIDESCLLQSINHEGEDIIFKYKVYEKDLSNYREMAKHQNDMGLMDVFVGELTKDKDFHEFMNILAISHSNLIFVYEGDKSKQCVTLKIPYDIIRNHCKVPSELLSIN